MKFLKFVSTISSFSTQFHPLQEWVKHPWKLQQRKRKEGATCIETRERREYFMFIIMGGNFFSKEVVFFFFFMSTQRNGEKFEMCNL
jgi:hypothetical protein